ncbi:MAG: alpha/beta fold hydrolase [Clostridiales bacterium]|nr:alpha/beta fold hydrolase [Clostridiales bacterium]
MKAENITVGANTAYPLKGSLTLPDDLSAPVPAAVLVHGSGPSNMDERIMKLTPFKDLSEGLAKLGVATLRYDKRTFTYKKELRKASPTVWDETIEDALFAIDILKNDPRVDRERIFIIGHSMGAMLAPRIDAEGGNVRGIIMMAGTPFRLEEIVLRQLKESASGSFLGKIVGLEYKVFSKKFSGLYEMSDEMARKKKFAGNLTLYYFKEMGRKTAADYLSESEKPLLVMQGGKDFQVLPDDDFKKLRELFESRANTVFRLYPDLNHLFVNAIYSDILKASKEYSQERHIGEEVIGDIASFILGNDLSSAL